VLPDQSLWLEVTEEQLADASFVETLVLIGQDVWHVQNRVLTKVSKKHPNLTAFKTDLKRTFSPVSKNAERLKATSGQELKDAITSAATKLSSDILGLLRWKLFQNKESLEARSLRLLSELHPDEHMSAEPGQAIGANDDPDHPAAMYQDFVDSVAELHPHAPLDETIFRKRRVTDVAEVQTISVARVRPSTAEHSASFLPTL
jgi:hypothetical protein